MSEKGDEGRGWDKDGEILVYEFVDDVTEEAALEARSCEGSRNHAFGLDFICSTTAACDVRGRIHYKVSWLEPYEISSPTTGLF